jgi:hypothetical protein
MSIEHTKIKLSQSLVSFVTSRGQRIKARVKELRVDSLAFEILSSENILQLSEVLHEVEVTVGGKLAFRGELSVIGLVPLGVMVVCEARISGKWLLESFSTDDFLANIDEHLEAHTTQWAKDHEIRPVFRAVVADLEIYLSGLETWCEQVECGALSAYHDSGKREEEILAKLGPISFRRL